MSSSIDWALLGIAVIPADIQDRDCAANLIRKRVSPWIAKLLPMAAMLEQSSKPHSLANRSNWKSQTHGQRTASRWYVDGGSSSDIILARRNRRLMAHYNVALIAEGYAKLAMICIIKRLAGQS